MSGEALCPSCQISASSGRSERQQARDYRQRAGVHALHLLEGQNDRADEQVNSTRPGASNVVLRRSPGSRLEPQHQHHGAKPERHVDQENRRPAESLREIAARDRPEGA